MKKPSAQAVEAVADQLEYTRGNKKIIGRGNVVVTYGDVKLTADYAEVERDAKKAYARGHVIILRGDKIAARGEEVSYDFANDRGEFPNGQVVSEPWFAKGKRVEQVGKGKYKIEDGVITTCDLQRPHYQIQGKRVTVYSGDKMIVRNVTLRVLGKPVFWWPYMIIPLHRIAESPFVIEPGYSSRHGAYILTSKGFSISKSLWGKWHLDWRSKRGVGGGIDLDYNFEKIRTNGSVQTYLTQDRRAPHPGIENPYSEDQRRTRGRFTWKQRTDFNPDTYALLRFQKLEDEFFLQDFFQREFRADVEPTSFVNFTHNSDRYGFYAFNQKRVNRFENVTERLPEIRFDWKNSPFFSDRIYYENVWSVANLNQKFSRSPSDQNTFRFDSFHEWSAPQSWNGFKLTPALNFRETIYSREKDNSASRARTAYGGSLDLRTQLYRTFNVSGNFLGIEANQLRHVLEPIVRYEGTFDSTVSPEKLAKFDVVDTIDDSKRIVLGLENRIQTKRVINGKMQRVDLVSLNTFLSYDLHPEEEYSGSGFSTSSGELVVRPYQWFQYEMRYEYDMRRDRFRELDQDLLAKAGRFRLVFGHRYVSNRPSLNVEGNDQFVFDGEAWLNSRWKVGGYIRWNEKNLKLEEWQISATRDMHDFLLDFGYNVRNSTVNRFNNEFFFLFRLKAFPQTPLKSGNRASFSEPRIGTTVAGSSQAPPPFEAYPSSSPGV